MSTFSRFVAVAFLSGLGSLGNAQTFCFQVQGAWIVAQDGQPLGRVANEFASDSIFNEFGEYGSEYSQNSIFNEYGTYGSPYSSMSAFNDFAMKPPLLVIDGNGVAFVTTNSSMPDAVNPYALMSCK